MADRSIQTNHYLQHLTELNQSQAVTASEDIYNQFGVLLIAKGSRINAQAQQQLQRHSLQKSLDEQIALEGTLSDKQIFQQILNLLEEQPELWQLHLNNRFDDPFRHLCLSKNLPLTMRQKLSVMAKQLPEQFEHSLFSGWAAALIAKEMGQPPSACRQAYVCGLLHDIGLLHIPPKIQSQTPLSDENWRALQSHVVIGQRSVEECGLGRTIGRGILEHHERLDQTGYPTRKPADKLGLLGQLVASADLLHSLCTNELSETSSIHAALPYFKIHRSAFNRQIHSALMRILSRPADVDSTNRSLPPVDLQRVQQTHQALQELLLPLPELSSQVVGIDLPEHTKVATMMQSISEVVAMSGLADSQLKDWLLDELDCNDEETVSDLHEIDAMQYELLWLLKRLGWNLKSLLASAEAQNSPAQQTLNNYQKRLSTSLALSFSRFTLVTNEAAPDTYGDRSGPK